MNCEEKKDYLQNYIVHIAMAKRIREMMKSYPDDAKRFIPQLETAVKICRCIEGEIDIVTPRIYAEILAHKYMYGKNLNEIAEIMNYSKRQIERLHRLALERFKPIGTGLIQ